MEPRAFGIIGMRRSGTSSVSLALRRLGVSFGDESRLFQKDSSNEEGYWEHKPMSGVHRMFRASLDLSVDLDPTPDDWRERPTSSFFIAQGVRCLKDHFLAIPGPWAWKDPDASLALPFVYEISSQAGFEPHLIICVRNPADTARSEAVRKGKQELETAGAWLAHTLTAIHDSRSHSRTIVLFSEFLRDPKRCLERVVNFEVSDEGWSRATSSVRPELVHSESPEGALDDYPPLVRRVYELCARNEAAEFEDEIENCYREFDGFRRMVRRPALEEAVMSLSWERGSETLVSRTTYRPTTRWQTVQILANALPSAPVNVYLYPLPANVWIRSVFWRSGEKREAAMYRAGKSANLHQRFGLDCLSLIHGPDHLVVTAPGSKGAFTLELEILIESNNLIVADTYKFLSERWRT